MQLTYFADDGNYGPAGGLTIVDTTQWTDEDWQRVEEAEDFTRPHIATSITATKGMF